MLQAARVRKNVNCATRNHVEEVGLSKAKDKLRGELEEESPATAIPRFKDGSLGLRKPIRYLTADAVSTIMSVNIS